MSNWLVTMNHCTQEKQQLEAINTVQADDESGTEFQVRWWQCQLAILFGIKMAWALQFFVLGRHAVVTYESHHNAGYFESKGWIRIIKGVKMVFFKRCPNFLSYKFDIWNGFEMTWHFIHWCIILKYIQECSAGWGSSSWTIGASGVGLKMDLWWDISNEIEEWLGFI